MNNVQTANKYVPDYLVTLGEVLVKNHILLINPWNLGQRFYLYVLPQQF